MSSSSKFAGLRSVLSDESADEASPPVPTPAVTEPVARAEPETPATPTVPKRRTRPSTLRSTDSSPKKRSSVTLSDALVGRVIAARDDHRWTVARLLETALDEWQDLTDTEAGKRLAPTGPRHRQQGISLTERYFELLDELGGQWRMNRSEAVTVVLEHQLDELGL